MSTELNAYGPDFQRAVLYYMVKDVRFCQKAVHFLKEDYFTASLKWFYRKVRDHFNESKTLMGQGDLCNEVAKHSREAQGEYMLELTKIFGQHEYSFGYIKKNLTGYIRANIYIAGQTEAANVFNSGSREDAYNMTKRKLEELLKVDFEDPGITEFGDHEIVCDTLSQQRADAVPTGLSFIDEAMGGGLMPQTWTTFLGGSNVGKSMLCPNLAYYAALKGKKTFVVIHEDEKLPTKVRYLARFSGCQINALVQPRHTWSNEMAVSVKKADEFMREHVRLRFMYGPDCMLERAQDAVREELQARPFQLYLNDYAQCEKSIAYRDMADRYGLFEYLYEQHKQLCLELNIAGAGGAQTNRAGHKVNRSGSDLLRGTDVGDSWGIYKKASNVITMNRSVKDVEDNRMVFLLDKVRDGRCPVANEVKSDFSRATTHLPYSILDKNQQELKVDEDTREKQHG